LNWLVSYSLKPDEATCRITCLPNEQRHEVWLSASAVQNPDLFLPDIVHELCHAKLAETVDVAFSTLFFRKRYGRLQGQAQLQFARKAQYLYWAWAQVDIWVNDLRHSHWSELSHVDQESFIGSLAQLIREGQAQYLNTNKAVFGLALQVAEAERHHLAVFDPAAIVDHMNQESRKTYAKLVSFYRSLPPLSFDRTHDLATLEHSVQKVAKHLRFPVSPKLVDEEGRKVWEV
jgi:hypothetical protein